MPKIIPALFAAAALAAAPTLTPALALADEIEDALQAALDAYRAGNIAEAQEEADYAATLLGQQKAAGLSAFLPAPMDGWTREDGDSSAAMAALFGGGMTASASYARGSDNVEIQVMADSPMITAMAGMMGSPAMMAQMGEVRRTGGHRYVVTHDGDVQTLLNGRVLVQVSGSAPRDALVAYFEAIDLDGLAAF
jgi:hypothetical protein